MIISVSRRTDIPAFYSKWFFNRLKAGYVDVINPFNSKQVNRYSLEKSNVDCFVFWTKNAKEMLPYIDLLEGYTYYFQYTINGYGFDIEPNVPSKQNEGIETFKALARRIGKHRVIWRYDPVIITKEYTIEKHISFFKHIAHELKDYTEKVVFSFVDLYKKTEKNTKDLSIKEITVYDMNAIAKAFSEIAHECGLEIATCCEAIDLEKYGIKHNKCIDDDLIYRLSGVRVPYKRDGQREACGCVKCFDIGAYNTCLHRCKYCYANYSLRVVEENVKMHNPESSLLIGELNSEMKIYEDKKAVVQLTLFDEDLL